MDYQRLDPDRWEWGNKSTHYEVRIFANNETLIWSVWAETSEGPQFGEGIKQTFDRFLEVKTPDDRAAPEALSTEIEGRITRLRNPKSKRVRGGWRFWKRDK